MIATSHISVCQTRDEQAVTDEAWDAFVSGQEDGHHEQSSAFARHRIARGFGCDRVVLLENGTIIGGAQILFQDAAFGKYGEILRGPLSRHQSPDILREVIRRIRSIARERSYAAISVQTFIEQAEARRVLESNGFSSTSVWADARRSYRIPLDRTDEELLQAMHYNVRRYTKRLLSDPEVCVNIGDGRTIGHFYDLHRQTAAFQGFPIFPAEYFENLWRTFGAAQRVQHFVAYHRNRPIAAVFNTIVRGTMYYGWGGIDRGEERRLHANLLVHLTAARWARERDCGYYDLCGTERFKQQLGIEVAQWPLTQRALFGSGRAFRAGLMRLTWARPLLRRGVTRVRGRFYDRRNLTW
jgi:peptidoglycan pentaglycine glycine transferase (the first glycine)